MIKLELSKKIFNSVYLPTLTDNRKFQIYYGGS